jgi:hypothetical protein
MGYWNNGMLEDWVVGKHNPSRMKNQKLALWARIFR